MASARSARATVRPVRAGLRGAREFGHRGRDRVEQAVARTTNVLALTRKRPASPALPRASAARAGGRAGADELPVLRQPRLRKLGEDLTEKLEVIPRQWKVIQHVREKFTCRDCEEISQAPAPFHVLARGWAGPSLLAIVILFEKFGQHQPLNRQADRYAREDVPLSLSTLAHQVGGCCAVLAPLIWRIERHVLAAERVHSDDTTVPAWLRARPTLGDVGFTCATTVRLAGRRRRRRCSTTRAIGQASTRRPICRSMPGSSKPMPMAVTPGCMRPTASRAHWSRRRAGSIIWSPILSGVAVGRDSLGG